MIRIVLAGDVTRDDLDDAAIEAGWLLVNIVPATGSYPSQIIYMTGDRRCHVHLIDDARLPSVHAVLQGLDEEGTAAAIRARLPEAAADAAEEPSRK